MPPVAGHQDASEISDSEDESDATPSAGHSNGRAAGAPARRLHEGLSGVSRTVRGRAQGVGPEALPLSSEPPNGPPKPRGFASKAGAESKVASASGGAESLPFPLPPVAGGGAWAGSGGFADGGWGGFADRGSVGLGDGGPVGAMSGL